MKIIHFRWNQTPVCHLFDFIKITLFFLLLPFTAFSDNLTVDFNTNHIYSMTPLRFTFSEPMIPLGYPEDSVPQGLSVKPHIPGKWSWDSQNTLIFSPESEWYNGNRYTITIPAGVSSKISDNRLKQKLKKEISIGSFSGEICHPLEMRSTVSFMEIQFAMPVHPDSLRRHISCTQKPLQLLTTDSKLYRIRPPSGWREGSNITLSVGAGLTPQDGNMPLDSALSTRFNVSDHIKFLGLFRKDKKVSLSDTLFLEDEYELRFSHLLHPYFDDYSLVNGKPSDNLSMSENKIDVNRLLTPGKLTTLSLKAGLPSEDSAFLFSDMQFTLIGDSNHVVSALIGDPKRSVSALIGDSNRSVSALPAFNIKEVLVSYDATDSIPTSPVSLKTPVRLLPTIKFDFVVEPPDSFVGNWRSGHSYCITPDGKDTLDWNGGYVYPKKLPSNANCTLMVDAGYRIGHYELKNDFIAIFHTGNWEFSHPCRPIVKEWNTYKSWTPCNKPYHVMIPQDPAIPLECYGSPKIVTAMRSITKGEEFLTCDSTRFLPHIWHYDTIQGLIPGSDWYGFVPIRLAPVLSTSGCGTAEVLLSVNNGKYDTLGRCVVTDLGMQLLKLRLSTAVIVNSLTKRLPVAGADVTLIGTQNNVLAKGETDSSGLFQVPRPLSPNFVTVATPGDTLVYRNGQSSFPDTPKCSGTLIIERGIYRPGDSLFFKGIVRRLRDRWEPELADSAVVSIKWDKAEPFTDTLPLSGCGSFSGAVMVPREAAQKCYTISAELLHSDLLQAEGSMSSGFIVSEFRFAELYATVGKTIIDDDSLKFTVSAKWLHGGMAGNSPVTWKLQSIPIRLSWLYEKMSYHESLSWNFHRLSSKKLREIETSVTGSAILDSTGSTVVAVARLPDDSGTMYWFSATVNGSAVQSVQAWGASLEIPLGYQLNIGIPRNTDQFVGDTVPLRLKLIRENARDIKGIVLHADIIHHMPVKKHRKNRCGLPAIVRDTVDVKMPIDDLKTDSLGIARLQTIKFPAGNYSVTIRPQNSPFVEPVTFDFTISGITTGNQYGGDKQDVYNGEEHSQSSDEFKIIAIDSGTHAVGGMLRIQLKAAQDSCNVLLMVGRENMYEHRWISMTGRDTVVTITLRDEYIPIVKIQAEFFTPLRHTSKGLAYEQRDLIKTVSVDINVSADSRRIPVKVTTDQYFYAPGDTVTVHVSVPQKSASATALVMVVDEGVLQLRSTSVPDVNDAFTIDTNGIFRCINECSDQQFYGPFDYDSSNALRLRPKLLSPGHRRGVAGIGYGDGYGSGFGGPWSGGIDGLLGNMMGGDGGGLDLKRRGKQIELRNPPRPCACFNPNVKFDAGGNAVCRFKLPGNLSQWRVTAIVDDTTSFGVDTMSFEANKPLMIRPQLPRFLRVGDSAAAEYIVENRSKNERSIASGAIVSGDTAIDTFTLHNDAVRSCRFPLLGRVAGTDSILFLVRSDTLGDGIKLGIPTIFERPHDVSAIGGSTIDSSQIPVILPQSAAIDSGNLELSLSTTRMQNLREGVKYLFDYPYGCLEQRSSKIIPLLVLGDFAERFHLPMLAKGDEAACIQTYLEHIGDFQNKSDGGLGYWPSDSGSPSSWLTAFVLEIMIKAKAAGYVVNTSVYTKAFDYLKHETHRKNGIGKKLFIDSYIQLILAQAGKHDRTALQKLYKTRNSLPLSAQINLLRAMYISGHFKRKVATLQKELHQWLIEKDRLAYFSPGESIGFEYCHESPVRQTALALEALLQTGSKSRFDEPMIRWLTEQRRSGRWRTTQENMAVFRAFAAYTSVYERDFPKLSTAVKLAGSDWFSAKLEGREGARAQALRSLDSIAVKGETTISVSRSGSGRLYWDLLMSTFPAGKAPAVSSGLSITRTVLPVEGANQGQFNSSNLRVGDLMKVVVTVRCNQDITFAAINDPIPAGCEVIDPELYTGNQDIAIKNTHWDGPSELSHREFRDSRVLLFADDMRAGEYQFSYILKPTTAGKFLWPAPSVEAMYYPEFYGRGEEAMVIVKDNR